jgi:HNH endonuclease
MKSKLLPPISRLRELFVWDAVSGILYNRLWRGGKARAGDRAGKLCKDGYRRVNADGSEYPEHRILWALETGADPGPMQIDHRNGVRQDNRFENLRLATAGQQQQNTELRASELNLRGVQRMGRGHRAYIRHNGKRMYGPTVYSLEEALEQRAFLEDVFQGSYAAPQSRG